MGSVPDKVARVPMLPGVYFFKNALGEIIYIGKAKCLRKRVQSYFNRVLDGKTQVMVSKIADLEYQAVDTEAQAQILEAALIKQKQPWYNIDLKDDKSFPWIRITKEEFPVISICRAKGMADNNGLYFGPYTNGLLLRQALKEIRKVFGFRSCKKMPKKPCLFYRVGLCPAPCAGMISADDYSGIIKNIRLFFDSKYQELLERLNLRMREESLKHKYEEAALIRDQISALSVLGQNKKKFFSSDEIEDLQKSAGLDKIPIRIEAFDISNISGKEAVGSMVSFFNGHPDKNNYRRFRIKTINRIDDYAMIREVVRRRYSRLKREGAALPDLVLIDGGRSHLTAAQEEIEKIGLDLPLASIAKVRENIYLKGLSRPIRLRQGAPALNLIRRLRDEAHRFALRYHHLLHRKKIIGK